MEGFVIATSRKRRWQALVRPLSLRPHPREEGVYNTGGPIVGEGSPSQVVGVVAAHEPVRRELQIGVEPQLAARTCTLQDRINGGAAWRDEVLQKLARSSGVSCSSASTVPSIAIPLGRSSPRRKFSIWAMRSPRVSPL